MEGESQVAASSDSIQVDSENKNLQTIICTKCPSVIMKPGAGTLQKDKKFFMHFSRRRKDDPSQLEGEELDSFWFVDNMMQFENAGFSRSVDGKYKYLTCSDCEQDVIGIQFEEGENSEGMYVATSRVAYK
eukprot:TRINITY_DN10475_c0_g1_i1.p1 TRINITY_DN10475_c0_g1~~TRINITY_DN10475_c0_g1_i1.p1  ORF type:complete len:131 (-),score=45.42 TRINITY_DN10475_c0_g1_i1:38-430(-)